MTRRFQFSLKDLLWLVLVVAGVFGGMAVQRRIDDPLMVRSRGPDDDYGHYVETIVLGDGTQFQRVVDAE